MVTWKTTLIAGPEDRLDEDAPELAASPPVASDCVVAKADDLPVAQVGERHVREREHDVVGERVEDRQKDAARSRGARAT